jgi:hypothetical protein
MIPNRSFLSSPNSLSSTPRAEPPREEYRELLPTSIVFLPSDEGGDLDPQPNLSLRFYCNPTILGALKCKDHLLLDIVEPG